MTCSEEELRRRLQDLGLPVYDAALRFEHCFGGMVWKWNIWGTYAALLERTPEKLWCATTYNAQEQYHGEPLLPVGVIEQGDRNKGMVQHWISREGWILLDSEIGIVPVAESATCFFEREVLRERVEDRPTAILRWRALPTGGPEDFLHFALPDAEPDEPDDDDSNEDLEPEYQEDPQRQLDERLAAMASIPLHGAASDRCMYVWYDGSRLLFPYDSWRSDERRVSAATMDDIVRILAAAASIRPTVSVIWQGQLGQAPEPGEEVTLELASIDEKENWRGHLLVVGRGGAYRVHERLFEKPLSLARLWEARREEWEAIEKRRLTR